MEYKIIICEASNLVFNIDKESIYKRNGNNLIGALVVKLENLDESKPIKKIDKLLESYSTLVLDSVLCISDKDIKQILEKYKIKIEHTANYYANDWQTKPNLFKKFTGIKLLVKEIKVIDYRDDDDENDDYDTKNDLFNPIYYEPDDWEFVLKVKKVL